MSTPRKYKEFWAVTDSYLVKFVIGYECPNPEQWWVPELGYSMTVGHHLFDEKEAARMKAFDEIFNARQLLDKQERELERL